MGREVNGRGNVGAIEELKGLEGGEGLEGIVGERNVGGAVGEAQGNEVAEGFGGIAECCIVEGSLLGTRVLGGGEVERLQGLELVWVKSRSGRRRW